jgi:hypothetical protein
LSRASPLRLEQQAELEAALSALADGQGEQAISDPCFANLYLFRHVHAYEFLPGPQPCIAGRAYDGAQHLLPLFDLNDAPQEALGELLAGRDCFYPLSKAQVERLDPERFESQAGRDDADYLYPAEQFLRYPGTRLAKKRNLVKQLMAGPAVSSRRYTEGERNAATQVLQGWMAAKGKAAGEADEAACSEALALSARLGLRGHIHFVGGEPAGFVLAQAIQPGVYVMRFAKGLDAYKGIYQHMFQHFCRETPDARWLNFEQDMGLANFRRTKLSYQPVALVPKYRVTLRGSLSPAARPAP